MANIVVTIHNAHTIKVDFGDYFPTSHPVKVGFYNRFDIELVEEFSDFVGVHVLDRSQDWHLSHDGFTGTFTVDSIDGVTINSNAQLAEEIANLIVS